MIYSHALIMKYFQFTLTLEKTIFKVFCNSYSHHFLALTRPLRLDIKHKISSLLKSIFYHCD